MNKKYLNDLILCVNPVISKRSSSLSLQVQNNLHRLIFKCFANNFILNKYYLQIRIY